MKLKLITTHDCNLDCSYCYIRKSKTNEMSMEVAEQAIRYGLNESSGSMRIDFFGGEPFLRFEFIREVVKISKKLASSCGIELTYCIETNGTLGTSDKLDFLQSENFIVSTSIDGDIETSNKNRLYPNGKFTGEKISGFLQLLTDKVQSRQVIMVVRPETIHKLAHKMILFVENNYSSVVLSPDLNAIWNCASLEKLFTELDELLYWLEHKIDKTNTTFNFVSPIDQDDVQTDNDKEITVDWNGDIFPCDRLAFQNTVRYNPENVFSKNPSAGTMEFFTCQTCDIANACGKFNRGHESPSLEAYPTNSFIKIFDSMRQKTNIKHLIKLRSLNMNPAAGGIILK